MSRPKGASADIAFNSICKKIEHYELKPLDVVSEIELSAQLNMSRTPVREAIGRLFDYGLVMRNNSKIVVKPITITDIIEILQVRKAVELMAVELIIHNGGLTDSQKAELNEIQAKLAEGISSGNLNDIYLTDFLFHNLLVSFCGNSRLSEIMDKLDVQGKRLRWLTSITPNRYHETCSEHQEILNSIAEFDLPKAQESVRNHIQNTNQNYENILSNNQWNNVIQTLTHLY